MFKIFSFRKKKACPQSDILGSEMVSREDFKASYNSLDASVVPLRPAEPVIQKKKDSAEVFNEAVNLLVEKLQSINENLQQQIHQNRQLVERMDALPAVFEQQRQAFAQVAEQLQEKAARDEKVAEELRGIYEKTAAAAETNAQMCDHICKLSGTLSKIDEDTINQTQWIQQMSRSFSASERFLKYTFEKQQTRFYWLFGISLGICFFAMTALIICFVLLLQR
ncbi:MAG TPA: hypothetical protein PK052_06690 [Anaerohalosphaeraceae bacterium]|nr:hypothetical protein [Anaerohalosphaeraceae bacterium]HOL31655.1 hypothetical protein [Anaerohalosphaeraceae bacterium]HPC63283.1 hypothetical protein [Anaerohalosphaeraceae bacterium]HPO69585.1 hypothetical protein [Anaerohalosphaeraceae bacterium]HRS71165.1 hypothetical protein [Anaerohalosphaeraceae bacterium]